MDMWVFLAVLAGAACHAGWNAIVKTGLDPFLSMTLVALAVTALALPMAPFVAVPDVQVWPWLLASMGLHTGYKLFLIQAYRTGDLAQVYPIARGTAPLLVAIVMALGFGESLGAMAQTGMGLLIAGIWLMSVRGGRQRSRPDRRAIGFALLTSVFIAGYTLVDGLGARRNADAHGYVVWLFVFDGLVMLAVLLLRRGPRALGALLPFWRSGLCGGAMSLGSYWVAIWAMTVAPIALVAALRETSVLFALGISAVMLREPPSRWRLLSALTIIAGIAAIRLG
ncbi:EamA family transporter [Corticibacter populi]|uniref:EamA family transporter n=1 Tax=Corticibacter populi TaxID=1550736 RepID=A0A3M6QPG0_9BURK|nr:EamA family transporter [Corticibacter populi]RMX04905.1 EamA family transporter [Corticibacter populi]RZS33671.1 EamA-like transporter family protein [Corticibacter populi]